MRLYYPARYEVIGGNRSKASQDSSARELDFIRQGIRLRARVGVELHHSPCRVTPYLLTEVIGDRESEVDARGFATVHLDRSGSEQAHVFDLLEDL